ncbi:nitroreductase family protein [Virgibacillus alimentarius]|uniref:Nitroreductase n=1 Tax=Virgibacillus alimentarius TaxID=698769 RepID=A0ABS4S8U8_9BACI|nr:MULTISPECIES: nitroreductase family protein [Virgibacillus]MBP2257916.1 nitroreductase [Virgibacillus alimentarius]HLR69469.1 nitroreductase family protein [Virgibacillus sp.]
MQDVQEFRKASYDIDPIYTKRWSPRSFLNKSVPEDVLHSIFEAARWAPSAANIQPWRFIIARTEEDRKKFLDFMFDGNAIWCDKAPVLVAVVSKTVSEFTKGYNPSHAFDTGTAWGYLALEAARKGLASHAMGGFHKDKAKEILNIPEDYTVHAIIAVGYRGDKQTLPEKFQDREQPSNRNEIEMFISEGAFEEKL